MIEIKQINFSDVVEAIAYVWREWRRQKLPLILFLGLSLNLLIASAVFASAPGQIEPRQAYAIGFLGFVILALSVYLFDVMFRPERY